MPLISTACLVPHLEYPAHKPFHWAEPILLLLQLGCAGFMMYYAAIFSLLHVM